MIIRIQGDGQYEVAEDLSDRLEAIDEELETAVARAEEGAFRDALSRLLGLVRERGSRLSAEQLSPSELILPPEDITLDELAQHLPAIGQTA